MNMNIITQHSKDSTVNNYFSG